MNKKRKNIISFNKGFIKTKSHASFLLNNGYSVNRLLIHYKIDSNVLVFILATQAIKNQN